MTALGSVMRLPAGTVTATTVLRRGCGLWRSGQLPPLALRNDLPARQLTHRRRYRLNEGPDCRQTQSKLAEAPVLCVQCGCAAEPRRRPGARRQQGHALSCAALRGPCGPCRARRENGCDRLLSLVRASACRACLRTSPPIVSARTAGRSRPRSYYIPRCKVIDNVHPPAHTAHIVVLQATRWLALILWA